MNLPEYITLNGTRYTTAKLSDDARNHVANIQVVDSEILSLQQRLGIAQTARNAYNAALVQAIKSVDVEPAVPVPAKKPRKPRAPKAA